MRIFIQEGKSDLVYYTLQPAAHIFRHKLNVGKPVRVSKEDLISLFKDINWEHLNKFKNTEADMDTMEALLLFDFPA